MKVSRKRRAKVGVNRTYDRFIARCVGGGQIVRELFERFDSGWAERLNVMLQSRPALKSILACDRELRFGEGCIGISSGTQFAHSIFSSLLKLLQRRING